LSETRDHPQTRLLRRNSRQDVHGIRRAQPRTEVVVVTKLQLLRFSGVGVGVGVGVGGRRRVTMVVAGAVR
jgi:hypothetical protein